LRADAPVVRWQVIMPDAPRARVLVVDDEENVRHYLEIALAKEGCAVTTARDGKEGAALLARQPFDVIFTDFVMPEGDGREVLRAAAERQPTAYRVLMSASLVDRDMRAEAETLAAEVLVKPIPLDALKAVLDRARPKAPSSTRLLPRTPPFTPSVQKTRTRRRSERIALSGCPAEAYRLGIVWLLDSRTNIGRELRDVSDLGVGLTLTQKVPPSTRLRFVATLTKFSDTLEGVVAVRWCAPAPDGGFAAGAEFISMPEGQAAKIRNLRRVLRSAEYRQRKATEDREKEGGGATAP
jgi:CheY-like chemotaxis protein